AAGTGPRGDLGVDGPRAIARPGQPIARGGEIWAHADREAGATEAAGDGGEVGVGEADVVERETVRAEVVDFRAVRGVVVDDREQRDSQPYGGRQLRDGHEKTAVAGRGDGEAGRGRHGGAQRRRPPLGRA